MDDKIVPPNSLTSTKSALKKTLDIICGKWRLHIIFQLDTEARRYGELRRMIPDVSEKVLIQELKALVLLGVLEKKSYNEIPPRVEYALTPKGLQILPTLQSLIKVGETFLDEKPLAKDGLSGPSNDGIQHDGIQHDGIQHDGIQHDGIQHDGIQHDGIQHDDIN